MLQELVGKKNHCIAVAGALGKSRFFLLRSASLISDLTHVRGPPNPYVVQQISPPPRACRCFDRGRRSQCPFFGASCADQLRDLSTDGGRCRRRTDFGAGYESIG